MFRALRLPSLRAPISKVEMIPDSEMHPRNGGIGSWLCLGFGLLLFVIAQSYLILQPLWTRDLPPEVDDSLAFLVRTQEMDECFAQNCPALQDLKTQFQDGTNDPRVIRQRELASFPFPFYHPLFSVLLLGLARFVPDLITAYKILWSFAPLGFGVAFACLLSVLWGRAAAGVTLGLLAFKVFPCTGLHYLTPSNVAMGIAVCICARIIQRRGNVPWTLALGTPVLLTIHPIGGIYLLLSLALAVLLAEKGKRRKVLGTVVLVSLLIGVWIAIVALARKPGMVNILMDIKQLPGLTKIIEAYGHNIAGALAEVVNLKAGLVGDLSIFLPAVVLGILVTTSEHRKILLRLTVLFAILLLVSLHHRHVVSPEADLFFRLWIPLFVALFGAVGNALVVMHVESLQRLRIWMKSPSQGAILGVERLWPVLVCAVLVGYGGDMVLAGSEIIQATREYLYDRQPLNFDRKQVEFVCSQSEPGDRILYTSVMPMAFYLLHGAMQRGAVYYHPDFAGTKVENEWLKRPDVRYAVTYNPTVFHPGYAGLDEKDQCISRPEYRYSPLSGRRGYHPVNREGFIRASDFRWIQLELKEKRLSVPLRLLVKNPGAASVLRIALVQENGEVVGRSERDCAVAPKWSGWIDLESIESTNDASRNYLRIILPRDGSGLGIGGVSLGSEGLNWPWEQKALMELMPRLPGSEKISVSFDPAKILPISGDEYNIRVLDDSGSSVLFQLR